MDSKIEQHEMMHLVENSSSRPRVVPLQGAVYAGNLTDGSRINCGGDVAEVGRPSAVLIDREFYSIGISQRSEPVTHIKIKNEWLLAQHMFVRAQGCFDGSDAFIRVQCDVHDFDFITRKHVVPIGEHAGVRIEFGASLLGPVSVAIAQRNDVQTERRVSTKVIL